MAKKNEKKDTSAPDTPSKKKGFSFKRLFTRKSKLSRDISKMEKQLTEEEQKHEDLKKKLFAERHSMSKQKKPRKRFATTQLLKKAGLDFSPLQYNKYIFFASLILTGLCTVAVIVSAYLNAKLLSDIVIFLAGFWTAGFALIYVIVRLSAATWVDIRIHKRRQELEAVLPDFLQLTAANIGAGMPIDRALWHAVRPRFGVLAKEIETVAKHVLTGEDLDRSLRRLTEHYESPVLKRSINLLLEGVAAGGQIADLLHKISVDIQEQRILEKEMAANVMTYVIFISFASVGAAPVLLGLSTQLLEIITGITANLGEQASSGFLTVSGEVISLGDFKIFSMVTLAITSVFSSFIISVIRKGDIVESFRTIPTFIAVSIVLYLLSVKFFATMFGGLL